MSDRTWKASGVRRVSFGGGEGGGMVEWLIVGALALIIVTALAVTFWPRGDGDVPEDAKPHYICQACDHRFIVEPDEDYQAKQEAAAEAGLLGGDPFGPIVVLDCPECGQAQSALPAIVCPSCSEWYVPQKVPQALEMRRQGVPMGHPSYLQVISAPVICPHCGANYISALDEKYQKEKAEE